LTDTFEGLIERKIEPETLKRKNRRIRKEYNKETETLHIKEMTKTQSMPKPCQGKSRRNFY
jgi:hypothetical protein